MQMSGRLQPGPALIACVSPRARTYLRFFLRPSYLFVVLFSDTLIKQTRQKRASNANAQLSL